MGKVFLFIFFPKFVASFTLFQPINMQTRTFYLPILLILFLCCPTLLSADEWDENLYRQIEASISLPTIGQSEETVSRYGASETASAAKNQRAIQRAIDHCTKRGGGKVVVPAGQRLRTGAIELKSGVNLCIEEGAVLEFVFEPALYPIVETSWEGLDCYNLSPCLYAFKAKDIAITGKGTIDGGGNKETWWPWCGSAQYGWKEGMTSQKNGGRARLLKNGEDGEPMTDKRGRRSALRTFTANDGMRPQLVGFNQCERVLIEDVTLLSSPFWVIHPLKCVDVTVRGVHINNDGPNGDGCDPESCNRVLIEHCFFNTGDDCIAIKSGRNRDGRTRGIPSQNIIIRHCEMKNGHGGVVIGSEISGGCKNVFAHDCVMDSPNLRILLTLGVLLWGCTAYLCALLLRKPLAPYLQRMEALGTDAFGLVLTNCHFNGVQQGNTITGKTQNIVFDHLFVNGSMCLQEKPYQHYSEWMTYSEMRRVPKSFLLDFSTKPKWSYVMGIELEAMLDTYLQYGGQRIKDYCQEYTDTMIDTSGMIRGYKLKDYNLDNIRTGHFVARMYQQHPEAKNLLAMNTLMKQLSQQPRTEADHVFWHKAIYSYQVWLDGIFMGLPYYTLSASMLLKPQEAKKVYDDAVEQAKTTYERTLDPLTGLNRHAWDETRQMFWADRNTGLSQHCWGRAQGWYTMALIELLDVLPEDYERRAEVIELLKKDLDAVVKWQDKKTGVWFQVMDAPQREGNYLEATCSSMFAYVLLKAHRKGYVSSAYRDAGIRAYKGIINHFVRVNADHTLSLTRCCSVAGLGPGISPQVLKAAPDVKENLRRDGSFDYYISEPIRDNDAKGVGPFIWASLEMEALGYNTNNTLATQKQ